MLLAVAATSVVVPEARAQQTEAELIRRLEELAPRVREAEKDAEAAVARLRAQRDANEPETVEFRVGPIRVITLPGEEAAALDVVTGVWEREFAAWVSDSPGFDVRRFFFHWNLPPGRAPRSEASTFRIQGRKWQGRGYMERGVRSSVAQVLRDDLGRTEVGQWAPGNIQEPRRPEEIYRELATVASTSVRACLSGDDAACLVSMGLGVDDDPVGDWYDQEERYLMARTSQQLLYATGSTEDIEACQNVSRQGCDGLFDAYVERHGPGWVTPIRPATRGTLVWFALRSGGEGAWSRLIENPEAEPADALEAAAGMPLEELVAGWRAYAVEHRPDSHADVGKGAAGALLWVLLLSTLATRSTRWRLG
jgi:hypothetical protein